MRHFPIYLDTQNQRIVVSGAGQCALAKLRIILKTEAQVDVYGPDAEPEIMDWAAERRITLHNRVLEAEDVTGALLVYAANDDEALDHAAADLARGAGVKVLIVDNLDYSDFITPAIVDRTPVTVAIGTEGAAPVLARKIKADVEALLPQSLGVLARIGQAFRPMVNRLPFGRARRDFWARYYFDQGPKALAEGEWAVDHVLNALLAEMESEGPTQGHVHFVGAGPGDPDLLTLKARKLLHDADVVIYDRLVSTEVLELARREALLIEVGKTPFGQSWKQDDINALLVEHGAGAQVVRLKSGDCGVFGRLDEEIDALEAAGIEHSITPGITTAAAAAAELKLSLTQRGRNTGLKILTGYQTDGFADHDWRALAQPNEVAAIYMGKAAAGFLAGRLLMHGAAQHTPITIVENVSRLDQTIIPATLATLAEAVKQTQGPTVLMLGLTPRTAAQVVLKEAL
jgi:uroporphyrin-III C-methyltransferase/precorrin-2 dehydrogenase/sirohydrochlorin ferrochelatase